jgi:prepilin-type processing-associated H-X9-DG protein
LTNDPTSGLPINLLARSQDIPIFICPSDPSEIKRPANWVDTGTNDASQYPEGRLSYLACIGTTSSLVPAGNDVTWNQKLGIFASKSAGTGAQLKGVPIVGIADGTSNTAMFSEVMRATEPWPHTSGNRNNTSIILDPVVTTAYDTDGRTVSSCKDGASWTSTISYIGTEFERALYGCVYYNHTLPPNWNKLSTAQQYNCGDTTISYFHISASSYHTGGVNIGLADGSVRFVRDSIDFSTWQSIGSRAGGETAGSVD